MIEKAKTILKTVFGYDDFRPLQKEVIQNVLNKKDTLVVIPTGGGKSLCYQIPALLFEGLTIVVSPLISLMKDQVEQLKELGVSSSVLNSSLDYKDYLENISTIKKGSAKLLYLAPETLLLEKTQEILSGLPIDCIAIDEAHCISEWGHDFRPEYRQLITVRKKFTKAVCITLTATATKQVQDDIQNSLNMQKGSKYIGSFDRKNLFIEIAPKTDPKQQTLNFLQNYKGKSGIIYCHSRKQVDELCSFLLQHQYSVKPYHAGLSDVERNENQDQFIKDNIQIIVATIAFGMGINKPNVRFVLHYDLPKNIESYYQQIGRAGRDGMQSYCKLLFGYGDIAKIQYFIKEKSESEKQIALAQLKSLIGLSETENCRRYPLLQYFGEVYTEDNCGMCDNCKLDESNRIDVTLEARKFLSCIYRTNQKFGAFHVIDVLRGSQSKKVLQFNHHTVSTYGIGKEYSKEQWLYLYKQLLQKGIIKQDITFGTLSLTDKSKDVLSQKVKVFVKKQEIENKQATLSEDEIEKKANQELFQLLKEKRKQLSDEANIPPYTVFPDRTLYEMSTFFPLSEDSLLKIYGVGKLKLQNYGKDFICIIQEFTSKHQLSEQTNGQKKLVPTINGNNKKRFHSISESFNSGREVQELLNEYKIQLKTLIEHFYNYIIEGNTLLYPEKIYALSKLIPEQKEEVLAAYKQLGSERLRPISDLLDSKVNYDDLSILRIYYLSTKKK